MKSDIHFPKNPLKDLISKYEQLGKKIKTIFFVFLPPEI